MVRTAEIISEVLDDPVVREDRYEELACLLPWLQTERFDRRAVNRALATAIENSHEERTTR